jgi:dethiobiotin synthetase
MKRYFVTGIDTNVGKTIAAAVLTEALEADYWKPIQSGELENSDTSKVKTLVQNKKTVFHPESYQLKVPASPHYSAALENIQIDENNIKLPSTTNDLIIEGAGGLFVPLNDTYLIIDLIEALQVPVVLVSKNYLGSINHTLLSIYALQQKNIPIAGIIFNGDTTPSTEDYILQYTGVKRLGSLEWQENISANWIHQKSKKFQQIL